MDRVERLSSGCQQFCLCGRYACTAGPAGKRTCICESPTAISGPQQLRDAIGFYLRLWHAAFAYAAAVLFAHSVRTWAACSISTPPALWCSLVVCFSAAAFVVSGDTAVVAIAFSSFGLR